MAYGFWKRFEPGTMDKRVTFCQQKDKEDAIGKVTNGLEEVITLWANFYPVRGQEFYEINKLHGKVTHKCYCRWHSKIADIDSTWYIKYRDKLYMIESAVDGGYDKRYFEIYCTEYIGKEEMPGVELPDEDDLAAIEGGDTWP